MSKPGGGVAGDAVRRSFETSPDTVYGVLVGLMVLCIFYLAWLLARKDRKLIELNVTTVEVLKDLNTALLLLKTEGVNVSDRLEAQIEETRDRILEKLNSLNR